MNTDNKSYKKYAEARAKKSPVLKDCLWAFFVGGAICTLGHGLKELYLYLGATEENSGTLVSVTLIAAAILLTGFGKFDDVAKHAGTGTLVPITGFANAVSSCAIDNKTEGFILGVGAKIFTIAGPVILYGISAGVVYGVVYWVTTVM